MSQYSGSNMDDDKLFIYICTSPIPDECLVDVKGVKAIVNKYADKRSVIRYLNGIICRLMESI